MASAVSGRGEPLTQVRVTGTSEELADQLSAGGFDLLPRSAGASIEIVADRAELARLDELTIDYEVLAHGRPLTELAPDAVTFTDYPRGAEIVASLEHTAATYPEVARLADLTSELGTPTTFQGRHLWAIKISDNPHQDEDEPAILILSGMHAREIVNPLVTLDAIDRLTSGYGHDASITALVDDNEIWIAPLWNPDGYEHVFNIDNLWRKNRTPFADGIGVDLNRNFPFGWDSECRGATSADSRFYRGPSPASEAETQTLLAFTEAERFAKVIEFHSAGRVVVWGSPCSVFAFDDFIASEAWALAGALGYDEIRKPSADGQHHIWQLLRLGTLSFLVETHVKWQPAFADALLEVERTWPGVRWMIERPLSLSGHVVDDKSGEPLVATISFAGVVADNGELSTSGGDYGRYHARLPAGDHTLEFSAPGYYPETHQVTVTPTSTAVVDVALTPIGEYPDLLYAGAAPPRSAVDDNPDDLLWGCGCTSSHSPPGNALLVLVVIAALCSRRRPFAKR